MDCVCVCIRTQSRKWIKYHERIYFTKWIVCVFVCVCLCVCSPGTLPNASPITLPISALIIDDRNSNEGQIIYKEFVALSLQDIKPDNIMLDKWLTLKIGDFGFARAGWLYYFILFWRLIIQVRMYLWTRILQENSSHIADGRPTQKKIMTNARETRVQVH